MRIENAKSKVPEQIKKNTGKRNRVSAYTESYKEEYYNIEINKLEAYVGQARKIFDKEQIQELAKTIKQHGILQPLIVSPSDLKQGKYEIISGERRYRAAILVGIKRLPCIILKDKNAAEEIALIENVQRENLHPIELMEGFRNLLEKGVCKTQQEISEKVGLSRTIVVETLNLQKLPESTQKALLEKRIKSRDVLRLLLKSPQSDHRKILDSKSKKLIEKKKIIQNQKENIISIYLENGGLVCRVNKKAKITAEQKKTIKEQINSILKK